MMPLSERMEGPLPLRLFLASIYVRRRVSGRPDEAPRGVPSRAVLRRRKPLDEARFAQQNCRYGACRALRSRQVSVLNQPRDGKDSPALRTPTGPQARRASLSPCLAEQQITLLSPIVARIQRPR